MRHKNNIKQFQFIWQQRFQLRCVHSNFKKSGFPIAYLNTVQVPYHYKHSHWKDNPPENKVPLNPSRINFTTRIMTSRKTNQLALGCSAGQKEMYETLLPADHPTSTRGVVIIYGWMGSIQKNVRKYADLYLSRDWAVVYGGSSITAAAFRDKTELENAAIESTLKAAEIIRKVENGKEKNLPLILHYLSNGGAFVAERLAILIKEAKRSDEVENDALDPVAKQELRLISDRLHEKGYEIIDSAPAYLHESALFDALDQAMPNPYMRIPTKILIFVSHGFRNMLNAIQKKDSPAVEFWRNTIESDLCMRQIYIYSVKDSITDSAKIDELIEERKKLMPGRSIISAKFEDSEHIMHLRRYPKEYMAIVDQVVNSCSYES